MKKVKLLLVSLSLLAVVGGALAFKAKTHETVCYAPIEGDNCPPFCPQVKQLSAGPATHIICMATTTIGGVDVCHDAFGVAQQCTTKTFSTIE